jgi:hypothetical protein
LLIPCLFSGAQTFLRDASPTATPAFVPTKCRHPALRITPLVAPHGPHRSSKRPRYVRLLREARLDQEHHRIRLGDRILGVIVMHGQPGDDDHAVIRLDP